MVTHRLFASHIYFTSQLNVLAPYSFFFTGQLNVLAYFSFFLFLFFTGRLNVLAYFSFFLFFYRPTQRVGLSFFLPANSTCWPLTLQPDGSHRLLSLAFPHAREILLEVLTIDSNRKLDTIQLLEHVCIPRQNLINLVRPVPSWRPLAIFSIFSSQW